MKTTQAGIGGDLLRSWRQLFSFEWLLCPFPLKQQGNLDLCFPDFAGKHFLNIPAAKSIQDLPQSLCWKANTFSTAKSRTGQYQANATSKTPNPLLSRQKHKARRSPEVTTHLWLALTENGSNILGRCQQDHEIWWTSNNSKKWWVQCQKFNTEGTSTNSAFHKESYPHCNPLPADGLQNQTRKSTHSQRSSERYCSLYIYITLSVGASL